MKPTLQAIKTGRSENEAASVGTLALFQDKGKLISSHGQITTSRIPRPSHTCTRLYCNSVFHMSTIVNHTEYVKSIAQYKSKV